MNEARLAATIMVLREAHEGFEVFMVRRSPASEAAPDVFVFPGGGVDPEDDVPAILERMANADRARIEPRIVVAAARELFEEAGILLARSVSSDISPSALEALRARYAAGTTSFAEVLGELDAWIDADDLVYFSNWITPAVAPRRFDAHFFVALAPPDQVAQADAVETHDGIWIAPPEALRRFEDGGFALVFPTIKHLERLANFSSAHNVLAFARTKPIAPVMPHMLPGANPVLPEELASIW